MKAVIAQDASHQPEVIPNPIGADFGRHGMEKIQRPESRQQKIVITKGWCRPRWPQAGGDGYDAYQQEDDGVGDPGSAQP